MSFFPGFLAPLLLISLLLWGCAGFIGAKRDLVPTESEIDKLYEQKFIKSKSPKMDTNDDAAEVDQINKGDYKSLLQVEYKPRYYIQKDPNKALMLSVAFPGLGQAYSESYKKGISFLAAEMILFATASYNLNRAHYYSSMSKKFLRFYDKFNRFYLSSEEGDAWAKKHMIIGSIYLISLGGIHLWNVFDAKSSAEVFNSKRSLSIKLEASPSKAVVMIGNRQ